MVEKDDGITDANIVNKKAFFSFRNSFPSNHAGIMIKEDIKELITFIEKYTKFMSLKI